MPASEPRTAAGRRLLAWHDSDARPISEFGLHSVPEAILAIEAEARAAREDTLLREALAEVGLPENASIHDLIRHHRNNEAAAQGGWKIAYDALKAREDTPCSEYGLKEHGPHRAYRAYDCPGRVKCPDLWHEETESHGPRPGYAPCPTCGGYYGYVGTLPAAREDTPQPELSGFAPRRGLSDPLGTALMAVMQVGPHAAHAESCPVSEDVARIIYGPRPDLDPAREDTPLDAARALDVEALQLEIENDLVKRMIEAIRRKDAVQPGTALEHVYQQVWTELMTLADHERKAALPASPSRAPLDVERLREAFEAGWQARDRGGEHVGSPRGYAGEPVDPLISHDESCCATRGCHPICSHLCGSDLHTCDGTDHAALPASPSRAERLEAAAQGA